VAGATIPVAYLKDSDNFEHLRGSITGGASGTTAFTLPSGSRPGQTYTGAAATNLAGVVAQVQITTAGVVTVTYSGATTTVVALDGINFLQEN
jgi:hypothetical protein